MSLTFPATIIQTGCHRLTCLSPSSLWSTVEEISEEISLSDLTVCLFAAGLAVGLDPEGYGNPDFCWISIYDKLIWSFAGPIAIVILVCVSLSVWYTFAEAVCTQASIETLCKQWWERNSRLLRSETLIPVVLPLKRLYNHETSRR